MPKQITEALALTVAEAATPGRLRVQLIDAGWGSSGYYSPQVLENAATDKVWPKGTHCYFDHPGEAERYDRPERSVRDLVMVLDEDAHYDPDTRALVAEAKVIGPYRDLVTDPVFMEAVGMSIRASADSTVGEAEGRKGTIVTRLLEGVSVDLVTRAGRGGKILAAVESARAEAREAAAGDTRDALHVALKAAHGNDDTHVWVRDFDPDAHLVWFEIEDADTLTTYQQGYTIDDAGTATLADGDPTPVRARIEYVPIDQAPAASTMSSPAPAGDSTATESEETNMATTQIEESRLAQLEKDSERVQSLESERDTLTRERDEAREALAQRDRVDTITRVIESVDGHDTLTVLERAGLTAGVTSTEAGIDEDALRTAVETAVAERAQRDGAGTVRGFGYTAPTGDVLTDDAIESAGARAFRRTPKES